FYDDPTVAYFSTHQAITREDRLFYPGTGRVDEIGEGDAKFTNCNAPLPADADLEFFDAIYREVFFPFTDRFRPALIILSSGYDAHWRDPLGQELLDDPGLTLLPHHINEAAKTYCGGRLVMTLEGGYHFDALAESTAASLSLLLGKRDALDTLGP